MIFVRDRLARPPRLLLGMTAAWLLAVLFYYSNAGVGIEGLFVFIYGGGALVLLLVIRLACFVDATRRLRVPRRWASWIAAAACLGLAVVTAGCEGRRSPLFKLRFRASEGALAEQARLMATDPRQRPSAPVRIGLFTVDRVDVVDGQVRFITSPCGVIDSCGLVYVPSGSPRRFQEDRFSHIKGRWWHLYEGF